MGVERFRTFEEARRALWLERGDPRIVMRLARLSALSGWSKGDRVQPGVTRFRTIADAKNYRRR